MRTLSLFLATASLAISATAFAGPADDAQRHLDAIASGKVNDIMAGYSNQAYLEWVGGPLNGSYHGTTPIRGVWQKFAKALAPLTLKVTKLEESGNPAGATVTANVEFRSKKTVKVRYVLTYRNGKLVDEVWQIDPKLEVAQY